MGLFERPRKRHFCVAPPGEWESRGVILQLPFFVTCQLPCGAGAKRMGSLCCKS